MSGDYSYKPRLGFDIRVRPPEEKTGGTRKKKKQAPSTTKRVCAWEGCEAKGEHRAPTGKKPGEFQYFCLEHVREFNKSWNYFKEMDEDQINDFVEKNKTGHRPTWQFGDPKIHGKEAQSAPKPSRTAGFEERRKISGLGRFADTYNLFDGDPGTDPAARPKRTLTKLQKEALETMGLTDTASFDDIKNRYKELVKRFHPDTNGGDTTTVERLRQVIKAYQVLKSSSFSRE